MRTLDDSGHRGRSEKATAPNTVVGRAIAYVCVCVCVCVCVRACVCVVC